jgi:hypothetical protein
LLTSNDCYQLLVNKNIASKWILQKLSFLCTNVLQHKHIFCNFPNYQDAIFVTKIACIGNTANHSNVTPKTL